MLRAKKIFKKKFPTTSLILRKILNTLRSRSLNTKIAIKWLIDRRRLPLTEAHRPLYFVIHDVYWKNLGSFPNLIDGQGFNDKIQWLKLFDQSDLIIKCADKIAAKDFIKSRVGDPYVVRTYQVAGSFRELKFSALPDQFVIKTNHDCGTVVPIKNKNYADFDKIENLIETALKNAYGAEYGEWEYQYIEPKILVEEYLITSDDNPPPDYKFHCIEGKVIWLQYIFDRGDSTKETIVEPDGTSSHIHFDQNMEHRKTFKPPANWAEMIWVAERLASGFKYLRVDLYNIENKIFVGELTIYPLAGLYKGEGQFVLGQRMKFDTSTAKTPIIDTPHMNALRKKYYPAHKFQY